MPPQQSETIMEDQNDWDDDLPTSDNRTGNAEQRRKHNNEGAATTPATAMEQLDLFEPVERPSVFHRESFIYQFASKEGPRAIVVLIVFLAMGIGSTVGVVPAVVTDRFARLNHGYTDEMNCADYDMASKPQACLDGSSDAQNASALGNLVSNVLTFVTSSLMGSLSDEHGRRVLLIMGVFLSTISPLVLVLLQLVPTMNPVWYYAAGACTGLINWIAIALSSLSDVMPPQWRAASFGMLLAGLYVGFATAPTLALLLTHFQVSVLAFCMVLIGFINTLFFFPETLAPEKAAIASQVRSAQVAGMTTRQRIVWNIKRPAWELSILNRSELFRLLSVLAFFSGMVSSGDQTLLLYYVEERLAFNDHDVAKMFLISGLLGILSQAVLLKPFIECAGERMVVTFCFVLGAADNFMYGIAKSKTMVFVAMGLGALTNMSFPTISAIKANNVNESEQGRIQGALYSVQALASGTGPMAMRFVYHYTKDGAFLGPGSMFVFASGLLLVASGCAFALPKDKADSRQRFNNMNDSDDDETTPFVAESSAPLLESSSAGSNDSPGSYGGTEML